MYTEDATLPLKDFKDTSTTGNDPEYVKVEVIVTLADGTKSTIEFAKSEEVQTTARYDDPMLKISEYPGGIIPGYAGPKLLYVDFRVRPVADDNGFMYTYRVDTPD